MTSVTKSSQLDIFSLIKQVLRTSTVLNGKFGTNDYYEYEPNQKSSAFNGFPYIVIRVPSTETDLLVLNHTTTIKGFNIPIILRVEFSARDNFKTYANAILDTLESGTTTFQDSGYYDINIDLIDTDDQAIIDQKEIVEGMFELTFQGYVNR